MVVAVLVLLLSQPVAVQAQDEEVLVDSAVLPVPQVIEEEHITYQEKDRVVEPPVYRDVPDSVVNRLKKQKDFAYANDPAYWRKEEDAEPRKGFWDYFDRFFSQETVRMIMYGLLIAFFLFIIYRVIVVNNLYLFYKSKKTNQVADEGEGDIQDENLDEKIIRAVDRSEHRLAVRFMYLKALRLLNDRQWIHYNAQATNYEYVNQMSKHKLASEFRFLTRVYDYVWYGEFALNHEQFDIVQKNFQLFFKAVK